MASAPNKPSVLIVGGVNTYSRSLAALLAPLEGEPLVSHLRIVDKFSVAPPTTYIGAEFPKILAKPCVEYKQVNLTVPETIAATFDPPEGQQAYDYVFDLTGEVRHDRQEMIQINTTCNVARMIGLEASRRKVKAYVRLQQPFYETSTKGSHDEKEDVKPSGTIGIWWHETLRMLAAIDDLNVVILRIGFAYGPYVNYGVVSSAITVASVYGYQKKPMMSMWSPGSNPTHTVHVEDVSGALWACAEWMAILGRQQADAVAGELIPFHNEKSKVKEVEGMPRHDQKLRAPLFNVVDDSNTTLKSSGQIVTSYFGTTLEFFDFFTTITLKMMDVVEEINESHMTAWTEMIVNSQPPIPNTPLSAYMDEYLLAKHIVAFNNSKIKTIVGYQLKHPEFNHDVIKDIVEKWKEEGSWPILP